MGFPLATSILGDWRTLYLVMLVVLVANWGINILVLKDGPKPIAPVKRNAGEIITYFKETIVDKRFSPMLITYTIMAFTYVLFSRGNQFLIESKGLTYVEAGLVTSLGTVAGFVGCLGMGVISARLRKRRTPIIVFFGLFLLALIGIVLIPAGYSVAIYAGLWALMCVGNSIWVLYFSMVGEILPQRRLASASG